MNNAYNMHAPSPSLAMDGASVLRTPSPPPGRFARVVTEPPSPAPVTTFLKAATTTPLSVDNLLGLLSKFPTNSQVRDSAFNTLRQMMLATIPDDWLKTVYGVARPTLDPQLDLVAKQSDVKEFLTNKFGLGYAAKALAGIPEASGEATAADWRKLDYYFVGKDTDTVLAKDPIYNRLNKELATHTYLSYVPEINDYLVDAKGTNKWATDLYTHIMTNDYLNKLVSQLQDTQTSNDAFLRLNSLVMLLKLLGTPTSTLSVDFFTTVLNLLTSTTKNYVQANVDEKTITDLLYQIIVQIYKKDPGLDPDVQALYKEDIEKMVCATFL
jgi:hypothetical protein